MPPDKITITLEPITFEFSPIYEDGGFVRVPHYMEVMKAFRQGHKLFFFHKITPIIQLYLMMAIIRKFKGFDVVFFNQQEVADNIELTFFFFKQKRRAAFDYHKANKEMLRFEASNFNYYTKKGINFNATPLSISELEQMRII